MKKLRQKLKTTLIILSIVLTLLLLWHLLSILIDEQLFLPTPATTFKAFFALFTSKTFYKSVGYTVLRSIFAFFFSFFIAIFLAIISAIKPTFSKVISPFMSMIRAVPTMAIILLLIIWISPAIAPVVISVIVICPTLYSQFLTSIFSVDKGLLQMSKVYKVPKKKIIFQLYLPNIADGIFEASASCFSLNIKIVIAGEALAQTIFSIGKEMNFAKIWLETPNLLAYTLVAILLAVAFEFLIRKIGKLVTRRKKYDQI